MFKNLNAKTITVTAMLVALSILWTRFIPTLPLGVYWSFTPFSHIFIFIGMFVSPTVGVLTTIGSFLGFLIKSANCVVPMRAASHIIFVIVGLILLKRLDIKKLSHFIFYAVILAIIHAIMETASVYIAISIGLDLVATDILYIWGATFAGTIGHSILDCTAALFVSKMLVKARVVYLPPLMGKNNKA